MRIDKEPHQLPASIATAKAEIDKNVRSKSTDNSKKTLMSLSAFGIQGNRNHMEDFFDIGYQMKPCDQIRPNEWPYEYFYFGIFDGHGGCEAARFAKHNLLKCITSQRSFWSNDDEEIKRSIRDGFAKCHKEMRKVMHTWSRTSLFLPSTAGTTASVLFIRNGKFYTGHVGDSRIVISRENPETKQWISQQITEDHKPESQGETERIKRAGGEVKSKIGVHRVVWKRPVFTNETDEYLYSKEQTRTRQKIWDMTDTYPLDEYFVECYQSIPFLAIARSLGDFWSINPYSGQYIVSPEPDVSCRPIDPNDKCILLASDGLWNVMNSTQVVRILQELNIIKNGLRQYHEDEYYTVDNFYDLSGKARQNHAQSMCYFAYQVWARRRLRSDNITVVVAMLHDILDYFHEPSSNKAYNTRTSGIHISADESIIDEKHQQCHKLVQISEASMYQEKVRTDKAPEFHVADPGSAKALADKINMITEFLTLPPTIIDPFKCTDSWFSNPRNYWLLALAEIRSVPHTDDHSRDIYILVKNVSDDPADAQPLPTRISASGKTVRDASAQATQSIHDFGQPWHQLKVDDEEKLPIIVGDSNEDEPNEEKGIEEYEDEIPEGYPDEGETLIYETLNTPTVEDDSDRGELDVEENKDGADDEDEDDEDPDLSIDDEIEPKAPDLVAKAHQGEKKSIPQLRCLLNYTPPLRRSQRNAYQSLSDNSKRKVQVANSDSSSLHKSKRRRKSQPIRRTFTRI